MWKYLLDFLPSTMFSTEVVLCTGFIIYVHCDGTLSSSFCLKPRMDEQPMVSKVLHLRNLPMDATERDLMALGAPFGVVNILLLKAKNQGFIELSDTTAASRMVNFYASMPATIRYFSVCMYAGVYLYVHV